MGTDDLSTDDLTLLEDRLRALGTAVAERTTFTEHDLDAFVVTLEPDQHRRRSSALLVAAAILAIVILGGLVIARRSPEGLNTITSTSTTLPTDQLPKLAPAWLPDGFALDAVGVKPGPPPAPPWLRRYLSGGPKRVPIDLHVRTTAGSPALTPVLQPGQSYATDRADVNGAPAMIHPGYANPTSPNAQPSVFTIEWDDAPSGLRVSVGTEGLPRDESLVIARGARIDAGPTAHIDPAALPPEYTPVYDGPDYGWNQLGDPDQPGGAISLSYQFPRVVQIGNTSGQPSLRVQLLPIGETDLRSWLASRGSRYVQFESNGMTFSYSASSDVLHTRLYGVGPRALIVVDSSMVPTDQLRRFAESIHPIASTAWSSYLASALTVPYPRAAPSPAVAAMCTGVDELQKKYSPPGAGPGPNPTSDGTDFLALADRAPAAQADQLRTVAAYLKEFGTEGSIATPDEFRPAQTAARAFKAWIERNCAPTDETTFEPARVILLIVPIANDIPEGTIPVAGGG